MSQNTVCINFCTDSCCIRYMNLKEEKVTVDEMSMFCSWFCVILIWKKKKRWLWSFKEKCDGLTCFWLSNVNWEKNGAIKNVCVFTATIIMNIDWLWFSLNLEAGFQILCMSIFCCCYCWSFGGRFGKSETVGAFELKKNRIIIQFSQ